MSSEQNSSKPSTSRISLQSSRKTRKQMSNSLALTEPQSEVAAAFADALEDILRAERQGY